MKTRLLSWKTLLVEHLRKIKLWVAVAVALGAAISGYYSVLGLEYWNASKEVSGLTDRYYSLYGEVARVQSGGKTLEEQLTFNEENLQTLLNTFDYSSDKIMAVLVDMAKQTNLDLKSASAGDVTALTKDKVRYQVLPMNLTMSGQLANVYLFITKLQETVLVASVASVNMVGVEKEPLINLHLTFYISPSRVTKS